MENLEKIGMREWSAFRCIWIVLKMKIKVSIPFEAEHGRRSNHLRWDKDHS